MGENKSSTDVGAELEMPASTPVVKGDLAILLLSIMEAKGGGGGHGKQTYIR